ncbi:ubiquinone biosynthesis protein COQ4 mitochondrial [Punctularia strigosozonata HHB-11173 SS5]|uniref:ubiquinone biosynthesis protein COQ4 mitochondrial n=1 Tax=Punctularia strigosozonata (strain HHB-11173) TaxID=741275 RepID=UPI0004417932|nr:ubiquinone biosynthesis protein COQ4 mitochondrial [Punctularia strigosozonata HHB-11173 SS5]EIN10073.1 ubiquinone biosynthesis protein COQ4 mitochondrial [Punctularia strigosozonata HHB-11173 SS5]
MTLLPLLHTARSPALPATLRLSAASLLQCQHRISGCSASTSNRRHLATRPEPAYPGHIPLNWAENAFLAVGSAVMSLADPYRGDMIAALGETTAGPVLPKLLDTMLASPEGRRIMKERPRINTKTVDMAYLSRLPKGTFGKSYVDWLERCGVSPDTREPVHYISDPEQAYVMQRYRETHDFYHTLTNMPVSVTYELAVKWFEFANLGLPMALLGGVAGPLRLSSKQRERLFTQYVPWALKCGSSARCLLTVYWEERWEQPLEEMKKELGVWDAPPARWPKPLKETEVAEVKAQVQQSNVSP